MEDALTAALTEVGAQLSAHAGGIELVDFSRETGEVRVRLVGTCGHCPLAAFTVKHVIEGMLKARLPWVVSVINVP